MGLQFLRKLSEGGKDQGSKKHAARIDRELPYVISLVTLMAASGISPFVSFKKLMHFELLPTMKREAQNIVKQVEILGLDPLTVMNKKAEQTLSQQYQDFLGGYASTVYSGGSVVNFLKSKMRSIFDLQAAFAKQSVSKLGALVEAYMVIQVIILTLYIILVALSSTPNMNIGLPVDAASLSSNPVPLLILPIILSGMFMFIVQQVTSSTFIGMETLLKKSLMIIMPGIIIIVIMAMLNLFQDMIALPYIVGLVLIATSLKPMLEYRKIEKMNLAAEAAAPGILRDIAEARKTGLSPEMCIIHACKRKGYHEFSGVVKTVVNQLEWGVPLRKIFSTIREKVSSWLVLINFRILTEVIESGGGHAEALEILAESSEKAFNVEKEKRNMLTPYVMIAFIIMGLTAFTTLMVIDSFGDISQTTMGSNPNRAYAEKQTAQMMEIFSVSAIFQSWLAGFFIGKVTSGTFASGFKYAIFLALTATIAVLFVDFADINLTSLFKTPI